MQKMSCRSEINPAQLSSSVTFFHNATLVIHFGSLQHCKVSVSVIQLELYRVVFHIFDTT